VHVNIKWTLYVTVVYVGACKQGPGGSASNLYLTLGS